jgi:hypothetical protein
MNISSPAVTLLSAASMNVPFVTTIRQPLMSISSRTRLGRHILRLITDFFVLTEECKCYGSQSGMNCRRRISALWKRWCINRCRYKQVRLYILNSGHSLGWRAVAPTSTVVAGKKVSGCYRATNWLRTIVYHGKCGEKHCWHLYVLAFDKNISAWRELSALLKYAWPFKPVCLSL